MPGALNAAAVRLAEVIDRENTALRAMDLRGAAMLLPEKSAAIADLAAAGANSSGPPHPALDATVRRLDGLVLENRRLLERAIAAQERVIGIVARAFASVVEPSYGAGWRRAPVSGPMALSSRA